MDIDSTGAARTATTFIHSLFGPLEKTKQVRQVCQAVTNWFVGANGRRLSRH
jgi:hypothetical protein